MKHQVKSPRVCNSNFANQIVLIFTLSNFLRAQGILMISLLLLADIYTTLWLSILFLFQVQLLVLVEGRRWSWTTPATSKLLVMDEVRIPPYGQMITCMIGCNPAKLLKDCHQHPHHSCPPELHGAAYCISHGVALSGWSHLRCPSHRTGRKHKDDQTCPASQ